MMQTIFRILERAGGYRPTLYLNIENPAYLALVIEATPGPGPLGLPGLSVAHYSKQNGDPMRVSELYAVKWKAVADADDFPERDRSLSPDYGAGASPPRL
jgi:hypothetical protein